MFKIALKSLLGRKLRLLLSTFAIVLGVAFVAGSMVFSDTLSRSFTALFASGVGDVVVRPAGAEGVGPTSTVTLPAALVTDLEQVEGAARVDGIVASENVFVIGENGKVIGGSGPPGLAGNYTTAPAGHGIESLVILEGSPPSGPTEVALDTFTAEKAGYTIGETANLSLPQRKGTLKVTVVGLAGYRDGGTLNGATMALFDTTTAQKLFLGGEKAFNNIWVTAEDGVTQAELRDNVKKQLPDEATAVTGDQVVDEIANVLRDIVSFIRTFLLVFAGIALVVGTFLIVNTFSILVAQRSRELALLRAMGASRRQVTGSVLVEAFLLGLIGSTIGIAVGVLLAMAIRFLFGLVGLDLSNQALIIKPLTVIIGYVVGVVVTTVAALIPALRTGRIPPVQAMRDEVALPNASMRRRMVLGAVLFVVSVIGVGLALFADVPKPLWVLGAGMLGALLGVASMSPVLSQPFLHGARRLWSRSFGAVGTLAGQNSLRNPRRTTATASALMIGLTLASTMAIVGASAKASVSQSMEENFVGDYVVQSAVGGSFSPAIAKDMAAVPGVREVIVQRFGFGKAYGDFEGLAAADPDQIARAFKVTMISGKVADVRDGTVLVSDKYAAKHNLGRGDSMPMQMLTGPKKYEITGIFEAIPLIDVSIVTTPQTLLDAGFQDADDLLTINVENNSPALRQALDDVVADDPVVNVSDQREFIDEQRKPIDQMVWMIYALLGLALIIAAFGIVNTLALSIVERTREVGLLRAIGLSRAQLRRMITLESVAIAMLGTLLGVALGTAFGVALTYSLRDDGLEVISVPTGQLAIFLVLAVVIGVVAAVFPARRAGKLDVLTAIATE
jgi:putative ABC transport system permease protein